MHKNHIYIYLILLCLAVLLPAACSGNFFSTTKPSSTSSILIPTLTIEKSTSTSTNNTQATYQTAQNQISTPSSSSEDKDKETRTDNLIDYQKSHYKITAEFNYDQHQLFVNEQIIYFNNSTDPIQNFLLIVEPARYPGVFNLNSLIFFFKW